MKTPEEIFDEIYKKAYSVPMKHFSDAVRRSELPFYAVQKKIVIEAMKEFGRQAWVKCASTYESVSRMEAKESRMYAHYLKEAYLNQIAKESQERGDYQNPVKDWDDDFKNEFGDFLKDEI